jgi:hypothetical protein
MSSINPTGVGRLRERTALQYHDTRVAIVSDDPDIKLLNLQVVEFYSDTVDEHGNSRSTFKIKVRKGE